MRKSNFKGQKKFMKLKNLSCVFVCLLISSCASVQDISKQWQGEKTTSNSNFVYYKDGRVVNFIKCEGESWAGCSVEAGKICQSNGYDVIEKNTIKETHFYGDKNIKELYFLCKTPVIENVKPIKDSIDLKE